MRVFFRLKVFFKVFERIIAHFPKTRELKMTRRSPCFSNKFDLHIPVT